MSVAPVKKKRSTLIIVLFIFGGLFVLCLIIGLISNSSPSGKATSIARSMTETIAARPTETLKPTASIPTSTFNPQTVFEKSITDALGYGNRDVPRLRAIDFDMPTAGDIRVSWNINDNLSDNLIKTGIQTDATDLLKTIAQGIMPFERIILEGYFPMVDAYGATTDEMVVHLIYNKATVEKIQWDNFLYTNIYVIADKAVLAPAVQP